MIKNLRTGWGAEARERLAAKFPELHPAVLEAVEVEVEQAAERGAIVASAADVTALKPDEHQRIAGSGNDPGDYVVIPTEAAIQAISLGRMAIGGEQQDVVIIQTACAVPQDWLRVSKLAGANGQVPNPIDGSPVYLSTRLPVKRGRLTLKGREGLKEVAAFYRAAARAPVAVDASPPRDEEEGG